MDEFNLKALIEKIVIVAKFQGYSSITSSNWEHIQQYYQISAAWNEALEAKAVLSDCVQLSKLFPSDLASDYHMTFRLPKNDLVTTVGQDGNETRSNSNTFPDTLLCKQNLGKIAVICKIQTTPEKYDHRMRDTLAFHTVGGGKEPVHETRQACKNNKMQSLEINLLATSTSSTEFGRQHTKRKLTSQEWISCLETIYRKGKQPYILSQDLWNHLKSNTLLKIPSAKSAESLKEEFFTHVLPNRGFYPANLIPRLNLRPSDKESILTIFHQIKMVTTVTSSIETLVADGVLSNALDWEGWFHLFCLALLNKNDSFWVASTHDVATVKELTCQYFCEKVVPKFLFRKLPQYNNVIDDALNEIALDMETVV